VREWSGPRGAGATKKKKTNLKKKKGSSQKTVTWGRITKHEVAGSGIRPSDKRGVFITYPKACGTEGTKSERLVGDQKKTRVRKLGKKCKEPRNVTGGGLERKGPFQAGVGKVGDRCDRSPPPTRADRGNKKKSSPFNGGKGGKGGSRRKKKKKRGEGSRLQKAGTSRDQEKAHHAKDKKRLFKF